MSDGQLTPAQLRRIHKAITTVPFARFLGLELDDIGPRGAQIEPVV